MPWCFLPPSAGLTVYEGAEGRGCGIDWEMVRASSMEDSAWIRQIWFIGSFEVLEGNSDGGKWSLFFLWHLCRVKRLRQTKLKLNSNKAEMMLAQAVSVARNAFCQLHSGSSSLSIFRLSWPGHANKHFYIISLFLDYWKGLCMGCAWRQPRNCNWVRRWHAIKKKKKVAFQLFLGTRLWEDILTILK